MPHEFCATLAEEAKCPGRAAVHGLAPARRGPETLAAGISRDRCCPVANRCLSWDVGFRLRLFECPRFYLLDTDGKTIEGVDAACVDDQAACFEAKADLLVALPEKYGVAHDMLAELRSKGVRPGSANACSMSETERRKALDLGEGCHPNAVDSNKI
jgi:hypothetical protein